MVLVMVIVLVVVMVMVVVGADADDGAVDAEAGDADDSYAVADAGGDEYGEVDDVYGFGDGDGCGHGDGGGCVVAALVLCSGTDSTVQCTQTAHMLQSRDGSPRQDESLSSCTMISYRRVSVPDETHVPTMLWMVFICVGMTVAETYTAYPYNTIQHMISYREVTVPDSSRLRMHMTVFVPACEGVHPPLRCVMWRLMNLKM